MQLYDNPASPFCRKVQVLAREVGIMDQIKVAPSVGSPVNSDQMPVAQNPLGKIPTLIRDDGRALYDSRVICHYLNDLAGGGCYPSKDLHDALCREALADGIMDAAVLMVYETRARPEGERSPAMVEALWAKVIRALDHANARPMPEAFDIGQIALACALGYLDLRHDARSWRDGRPALAAWFESISERDSMAKTVPDL
ncbi:MAG: glutathione S-transferase family protein [Pseudomonadota bacterium]